ncbi:MAG: YHS domain-containing protein [candidate division Zixibacteria bacterium]|nr:YHS domain-containing protein [candidate division Zixibacteria bacterium]
MAKDPVCGMDVDESSPAATAEYEGQTYYFCAPGCRAAFEADPEKYLGREEETGGCGG